MFLTCAVSILKVCDFLEYKTRSDSGIYLNETKKAFGIKSGASFHGDGMRYEVYTYDDEEMKDILLKIRSEKKWAKYPLDPITNALVYGRYDKNGLNGHAGVIQNHLITPKYSEKSSYKVVLPNIKNGYYLLIDRSMSDPEKTILERSSYNLDLYLLDLDTNTIYYVTLDT